MSYVAYGICVLAFLGSIPASGGPDHRMARASRYEGPRVPLRPVQSPSKPTDTVAMQEPRRRLSDESDIEWAALNATVESGSGWPVSWNSSLGGPCGDGWENLDSGWVGVRCAALGGRINQINIEHMPDVVLVNLTGDISSWGALTGVELINLKGAMRVSGNVTGWSGLTNARKINLYRIDGISGDVTGWSAMTRAQYINLYRTSVSGNLTGWQAAMPNAAYINVQAATGSILVNAQAQPVNLTNQSTGYAYWMALAAAAADSGPEFYSRSIASEDHLARQQARRDRIALRDKNLNETMNGTMTTLDRDTGILVTVPFEQPPSGLW